MHRITILSIASLAALSGCRGASIEKGLATAQKGLSVIDVGSEHITDEYVEAVEAIRDYCSTTPDVDACEARYRVTDADTEKVADLAEEIAKAYDAAAQLLQAAGASWGQMAPVIEQAKGVADGLDR